MSGEAPFIFNPTVDGVQSKQQGITFVAVGFGLVSFTFVLKSGKCQQVRARVNPRVLQLLPLPRTVGGRWSQHGLATPVWRPVRDPVLTPLEAGCRARQTGRIDRGSTQPCCTSALMRQKAP